MYNDWSQLVKDARRGKPEAMRLFYNRLAPMAMGVCMRYSNNRQMAEEFMQDGFVRVFEKLGQLHDPDKAAGWVKQVMVHTCMAHYRRKLQHGDVETEVTPDMMVSFDPSPFAAADIVNAIQQLPERQRLAFNLCEVEDLSFADAAQQMGIAEVSVRSNLVRAKQRLRELLIDYLN